MTMRKIMISIIGLLLFSLCYSANVSTSPHGINVHLAENDVLQKVKDAGIKWIRTGANWAAVEATKGTYDWNQLDRTISYADSNDLSVLFVIAYTPGWANNNRGIKYPADNVAEWENFVRIVVNRYKDRVKYWNIWNEPNSEEFFGEGKDLFVQKVFLPAARVIRSTDPSAFIVGPELAHLTSINYEWYFWMKYILEEAGDYIDIISHHIYKNEGVYYIYELLETGESLIPSVQQIIEETGNQSKPFWITETGWDTATFSEEIQSERYLNMLKERRIKSYPNKIFFYEIKDDPATGITPWGILRIDLSEKAAYTVYKDFIAGKYPEDGTGSNEEPAKKPCFAEKVSGEGNGGRWQVRGTTGILSALRLAREEVSRVYPAARNVVRLYYDISDEMILISFSDSRLLNLATKLVNDSGYFIDRNRDTYLTRMVDPAVIDSAQKFLQLMNEKSTSPTLRQVITWGKKQMGYIKTMPLADYFRLHLSKEVNESMERQKITYHR
jgi:Glycosyl hydrolases family 39